MYNYKNKQFVFKQTSGKISNFYYDERQGLCYSTLTRRNTWAEPVVLQKNLLGSFAADMDLDDTIHILFQDNQGSIFYSQLGISSMRTIPVLNSKTPSPYDKHLNLIPFKGNTHFFYTIQHNNSMILAHQLMESGSVNAPKVIDYVTGNELPYSVASDKSGNIYAFYQTSDGKFLQIGYKKFVPSQKFWGEFTPITRYNGDCSFHRIVTDHKSIMHLCYQRRNDKQYELVYQQKIPDKNIWTNELVIHSSPYSFENCSIAYANDSIVIYWVREDVIYYSSSKDDGSIWSKPARYNFPSGKQLVCIGYKSNNPYESEKFCAHELPGNFINGYRLAFFQETSNSPVSLSADELREMLIEGLKMLKASVEDLREADMEIKSDVSQLDAEQKNIEKELTKLSLKQNMLDSDINQLKQINNQLDGYSNIISELKQRNEAAAPDTVELKNNIVAYILEHELFHKLRTDIEELKAELYHLREELNNKKLP